MAKKNLAENYPYDEVRPLSDFKQMLDDNAERLGNKPAFKFKEDGEAKGRDSRSSIQRPLPKCGDRRQAAEGAAKRLFPGNRRGDPAGGAVAV